MINLKEHITFHNKEYTKIFPDNLKPKHHFLNYYYRVIENSGPLKHLWTLPFESKHKELKSYTKNINSRKNVPLSLALKYLLIFSEFVINFDSKNVIFSKSKCSP